MKINAISVTIRDLCKNYKDDGDDGVFAYDGKLCVRPKYQREFVYKDNKRNAVIDTVMKNRPLT